MSVSLYGSGQTVLQVVQVTMPNVFSTTSSTYTNVTGFAASITPQSTTSKILILINSFASGTDGGGTNWQLARNGSGIGGSGGTNSGFVNTGNDAYYRPQILPVSWSYLDSPSTTSSTTYQVQILATNGGTSVVNQYQYSTAHNSGAIGVSTITLLEISGS